MKRRSVEENYEERREKGEDEKKSLGFETYDLKLLHQQGREIINKKKKRRRTGKSIE